MLELCASSGLNLHFDRSLTEAELLAIFGMLIGSAGALVAVSGDTGGTSFLLTAAGLALVVLGPLMVSNRLAEPNYDVSLDWSPDALPANWTRASGRYFALNWIRAAATWTAFGLYLAALVALLLSPPA